MCSLVKNCIQIDFDLKDEYIVFSIILVQFRNEIQSSFFPRLKACNNCHRMTPEIIVKSTCHWSRSEWAGSCLVCLPTLSMSIFAYLLGVNSISCSIDKTVFYSFFLQELVLRKKVINDFIDGTQKFRGSNYAFGFSIYE